MTGSTKSEPDTPMAKLYKRNKIWWLTDGGGPRRVRKRIGPVSKVTAEKVLKEYQDRKVMRLWGLPLAPERITVTDFIQLYLDRESQRTSEAWWKRQRQILEAFRRSLAEIAPDVLFLDEISPPKADLAYRHRIALIKPKTARFELSALKQIFDFAVGQNYLPANPFISITGPRGKSESYPPFTANQCAEILNSESRYRDYFAVLLFTGLRAMDVASLTLENIDRHRECIVLETQKTSAAAEIPIHPEIRFLLTIEKKWLFSENPKHFYRHAYASLKSIIYNKNWDTKLTIHSFRVTFNNLLRDLGVQIEDRAVLLTHSSTRTTKDYTRQNLEKSRQIINTINIPRHTDDTKQEQTRTSSPSE